MKHKEIYIRGLIDRILGVIFGIKMVIENCDESRSDKVIESLELILDEISSVRDQLDH